MKIEARAGFLSSSLPPQSVSLRHMVRSENLRQRPVHDDQERRRFLSEARAIPPLISGLMINSSTVDAQAHLQQQFDRHTCQPEDAS
jgi:hypothetical protein